MEWNAFLSCFSYLVWAAARGEATGVKGEAVYDEPEDLQQYRLKGDGEIIDLKDCPAYGKPTNTQEDIKLKECPAYLEHKMDLDINLQECPAYGESSLRPPDVELEKNPVYLDIAS